MSNLIKGWPYLNDDEKELLRLLDRSPNALRNLGVLGFIDVKLNATQSIERAPSLSAADVVVAGVKSIDIQLELTNDGERALEKSNKGPRKIALMGREDYIASMPIKLPPLTFPILPDTTKLAGIDKGMPEGMVRVSSPLDRWANYPRLRKSFEKPPATMTDDDVVSFSRFENLGDDDL